MNYKRTGDISYHPCELPKEAQKIADKEYIVAIGEATGHNHEVKVKEGSCEIYKDANGEIFIVINGTAIFTHPEHKTIEVGTGTYKVVHEREFDWFALKTRKVLD